MMTRSGNLLLLAKVALNKPKPNCAEISVQTDPVKFSSAEETEVPVGQPGKPILLNRSGNSGHDYLRPNECEVIAEVKGKRNSHVDSSCQADLSETLDGDCASLDVLSPPINTILEEIVQDFDPDQWADLFNQQDNLDEILHPTDPKRFVEEIVDSLKSYEGNLAATNLEKQKESETLMVNSDSDVEVKPVVYRVDPDPLEEVEEAEENLLFEMAYVHDEEVVRSRIAVGMTLNTCLWEMCGAQCDSPAHLFEHIKDVHVDPTSPLVSGGGFYCCVSDCPVPDRKFTKRFWLLDHIRRRHIPVGLFQCSECDKHFCTKELVRRHLKSHKSLEVRDYQCRLCPKTFRHSTDLSRHKKTHKDKRPFKCKYVGCGKDYTDHSGLRKHLSLHHTGPGEKKIGQTSNDHGLQSMPVMIDDFDDPMVYLEEAGNPGSPVTFTFAASEPSTSRSDVLTVTASSAPDKKGNISSQTPTPGKLNNEMILKLFNLPILVMETPKTEDRKVFWLKRANFNNK